MEKQDWENIKDGFYHMYLWNNDLSFLMLDKEDQIKTFRFRFFMVKWLIIGFIGSTIENIMGEKDE